MSSLAHSSDNSSAKRIPHSAQSYQNIAKKIEQNHGDLHFYGLEKLCLCLVNPVGSFSSQLADLYLQKLYLNIVGIVPGTPIIGYSKIRSVPKNSNQQILKRIKSPNQISRAPKPQTNNTELIYSYIREGNFNQAIEILEVLLDHGKRDRGVLSVLAFCYFSIFDFQSASTCYQELTQLCPEVLDYMHHLAQCLYKLGKNDEALVVCNKLEGTYLMPKVQELKAAICYDKNDFQNRRTFGTEGISIHYACFRLWV